MSVFITISYCVCSLLTTFDSKFSIVRLRFMSFEIVVLNSVVKVVSTCVVLDVFEVHCHYKYWCLLSPHVHSMWDIEWMLGLLLIDKLHWQYLLLRG